MTSEDDQLERAPSKSQRKREAQALTDLGARLVALPPAELARLPLSDALRQAVEETRALGRGGARKRQLKYLGKLLRHSDAAPLEQAITGRDEQARRQTALQHRVEAWRDRLIEEGDAAVQALVEEFPEVQVQRLRQLVRKARDERERQRPPAAARALFRVLRDVLG